MERDFEFALGKMIMAIAWADGELEKSEKRILDSLMGKFTGLTDEDRSAMRLYMEYPITEHEEEIIIDDFCRHCKSEADREFAFSSLESMIEAGGDSAHQLENELFERIKVSLKKKSGGIKKLFGIFGSSKKNDDETRYRRENELSNYLDNPLFFLLKKQVVDVDIAEIGDLRELEQLTLFGAIVSYVVQADDNVSSAETMVLTAEIMNYWKLPRKSAEKITQLILDYMVGEGDIARYCANFLEHHTTDDLYRLFSILVVVIKADGQVLPEEIEILRYIAKELKVDPDFVEDNIPKQT